MKLAVLLFLFFSTPATFLVPTVRTSTGQRVSLHGTGPPVVFSSGLFGTMPRRIYTQLFRLLRDDVTLVVLEDVAPVTGPAIDAIADALAVEDVALLSHSSVNVGVLRSDRVRAAVMCDPVVLPVLDVARGGLVPPDDATPRFPTRVLRAAKAYETNGIPEMVSPRLEGDTRTFDGMGHADLLDDAWAELGPRVFPWMKGVAAPRAPFVSWSLDARTQTAEVRRRYREEVATEVRAHVLPDQVVMLA